MKKGKILLVIFIIANILLIVTQNIYIDKLLDENQDSSIMYIKNYKKFEKIYGSHASIQFYKKDLQLFLTNGYWYIYEATQDMSESDLEEFFDKYSESVKIYGITSKDDFKDISKTINNIYANGSANYKEILIKSCKKNNDYIDTIITVKYESGISVNYKYSVLTHNARLDSTKNGQRYKITIEEE